METSLEGDKLDRVKLYIHHDESPFKDKIFVPEF